MLNVQIVKKEIDCSHYEKENNYKKLYLINFIYDIIKIGGKYENI